MAKKKQAEVSVAFDAEKYLASVQEQHDRCRAAIEHALVEAGSGLEKASRNGWVPMPEHFQQIINELEAVKKILSL